MEKKYTSLIAAVVAAQLVGSAIAEEQMHDHFPRDVDAFHSVLAPLWHARPGKERSRDACAKADELESLAKDIRSADASPLLTSVAALKKTCQSNQADIDAALFGVHEAFHGLAEQRCD